MSLNSPLLADAASTGVGGDLESGGGRSSGGSREGSPLEHASRNKGGGHSKNMLPTLNGVFVPCSLNIMGIILFLRFGWGVGQAGVVGVLGALCLAFTLATLTVLSFSTIVTNGNMQGGGSYFMISRSLGPELGGAIGALFYLAYSIGCCFYIVGFATEMQTTFWPGVTAEQAHWLTVGIASAGLFVCLLISVIGADAFAKFNTIFFLVQFGSIFVSVASMWFIQRELDNGGVPGTYSYGANYTNFLSNLYPDFTNTSSGFRDVDSMCGGGTCNFAYVFAVLFPCATGIMEGANLSGDLKDPARSIPKGTLIALLVAFLTYVVLILSMAAGFDRHTLRINMTLMQDSSWLSPYLVIVGILISALSSTLGSLFGGSRVLQALARDDLFPLGFFAKGTARGDEPRRAVVLTWAIAQCALFMGNLDVIAPIISAFFLLSYALCNLTALLLRVTGAPNFRPLFRYSTWHTSLLGFILCIGVMFYLNVAQAVGGIGALVLLYGYIAYKAPTKPWGDVSQALLYHQVRKWLLVMDKQVEGGQMHVKYWRPSVLLLADHMAGHEGLLQFCADLKKGGLLVVGNVLVGEVAEFASTSLRMRRSWITYIQRHKIKAFPQVLVAPTLRSGYQFLLQGSGLGGLRCNTLVVPLFNSLLGTDVRRTYSFYNDVAAELGRGEEPAAAPDATAAAGASLPLVEEVVVAAAAATAGREALDAPPAKAKSQAGAAAVARRGGIEHTRSAEKQVESTEHDRKQQQHQHQAAAAAAGGGGHHSGKTSGDNSGGRPPQLTIAVDGGLARGSPESTPGSSASGRQPGASSNVFHSGTTTTSGGAATGSPFGSEHEDDDSMSEALTEALSAEALSEGDGGPYPQSQPFRRGSQHRKSADGKRQVSGNLPVRDADEYVQVLHDALQLQKNILLTTGFQTAAAAAAAVAVRLNSSGGAVSTSSGGGGGGGGDGSSGSQGGGGALDASWSSEEQHGWADEDVTGGARPGSPSDGMGGGGQRVNVDVWVDRDWTGDYDDTLSLMLQLARIVQQRKARGGFKLRVMRLMSSMSCLGEREHATDLLRQQLQMARITEASVHLVITDLIEQPIASPTVTSARGRVGVAQASRGVRGGVGADWAATRQFAARLNAAIAAHSNRTAFVFMHLPALPAPDEVGKGGKGVRGGGGVRGVRGGSGSSLAAGDYVNRLRTLAMGLPPSTLCMAGECQDFITTDI